MKIIKSVLAFLLACLSAFSMSCAADFLFGRIFGVFQNTFLIPFLMWAIIAPVSMLGALKLSDNKWLIVLPMFFPFSIALFGSIVGSHPHSYLVTGILLLIIVLSLRMEGGVIRVLGNIFEFSAFGVFAIAGIWGYFLCLWIITTATGFWGLVASLFLTPITFFAAPFYAGFAWGNWFPLSLEYGGGITAAILFGIGKAIRRE
jgi:hypothetical protein